MLIMSMVLGNMCACGAVFRPKLSRENHTRTGIDTLSKIISDEVIQPSLVEQRDIEEQSNRESLIDRKMESGEPILNPLITGNPPIFDLDGDKSTLENPILVHPRYKLHLVNALKWFYEVTGFHLFAKSYRFIIICVTQMQVGLCAAGVIIHIVNHVSLVDSTVTTVKASLLISMIGIGSLVARLSHGFLVDRNWLTPLAGYIIGVMCCSVAVLISPAIKEYRWFAVYVTILGMGIGLNLSLQRVLVKEYLGVEDLAQGIGLSAVVFVGAGELIGPVLSGNVESSLMFQAP